MDRPESDNEEQDSSNNENNEREATELHRWDGEHDNPPTNPAAGSMRQSRSKYKCIWAKTSFPFRKFWKQQVYVSVPHDASRDHLALERTYLGYVRTSMALVMLGTIVAQLFRLQHTEKPNPHIGYFVAGTPLAAVLIIAGMAVLLFGAYRTWRQQNAMLRGKIHAGGWEMNAIAAVCLLVTLALFLLLVVIDADKG